MLKKDSNRLFQTMAREGFDPKLFTIENVNSDEKGYFDQIQLKGTPLRFFIKLGKEFNSYDCKYTRFTPDFRTILSHNDRVGIFCDIDKLEEWFIIWLQNEVKHYLSDSLEPDLWQQMQLETPLVTGEVLSSEDTGQFTDEEKRQIKLSINEFKLLVLDEFKPSNVELETIDGRITYLTEAVDRLNRLDWRSVAISTVIAISIALTLDTEGGRQLFDLFTRAFSSIAGLLPPV